MILWYFPSLGGKEFVSLHYYYPVSEQDLSLLIFFRSAVNILTTLQLLHHGLSMYAICLALFSGKAHMYILMVLFTEATTPFVNLRW